MKKLKKTFGENLEQFEIAKLKKKYEDLGYDFRNEYRITRKGKQFYLDGYAKHPETKDEIIFEVKALETLKKGSTQYVLDNRSDYLKYFPNARYILVVARTQKTPDILESNLNSLLLGFIKRKYKNMLGSKIADMMELDSVKDVSYSKIDLGNFKEIKIVGFANLKFWIKQHTSTFRGVSLSDGIPFSFNILLNHTPPGSSLIYEISDKSEFSFDLTEFNK